MTYGNPLRTLLMVCVLVLAACGADSEISTTSPAPQADTIPTSSAAPSTTTEPPAEPETEEAPVSETLDPAGTVDGGTVGRSFVDEDYPTELDGIVALAVDDLAERLSIDASLITVVLVEEVVWGDSSLGCPQPGMSYTQVLTDGMRIVLEANGQLYDYRSGGMSDPILCVQAVDTDKSRAGVFELTPDGEVIFIPTPGKGDDPIDSINPPDK